MTKPAAFDKLWCEARDSLAARDPVLAGVIQCCPGERLEPHGDVFRTLARAITGQQIPVLAAELVRDRVIRAAGEVTPKAFMRVDHDDLRSCGLTANKMRFLASLARQFADDPALARG